MYITSFTAQQEGTAQGGLCTILVQWTTGDPKPDLVEIYVAPIYAQRAMKGQVDPDAKEFRTQVAAGGIYNIYLCPRLVESNQLDDQMPDGYGGSQYWEAFCLMRTITTQATPPPPPPPANRPVPYFTSAGPVLDNRGSHIQVFWASQKAYNFYQIRWAEKGWSEAEVRLAPGVTYFELSPVFSPAIYTFRVQGCDSGFLGGSQCSAWSATVDVYVGPGWGESASPVANLSATPTGRTGIHLSWQATQPYDTIRVERRFASDGNWEYPAATTTVDLPGVATAHDDTGLYPNTIYRYRVTGLRGRYEPRPAETEATTWPQPASSPFVATRHGRNTFVLATRAPDESVLFYGRVHELEGLPWGRLSTEKLFGPVTPSPDSTEAPLPLYPINVGLIESNYARAGGLELMVRIRPPAFLQRDDFLLHFYRDPLGTPLPVDYNPWHGGRRIEVNGQPVGGVTGRPAFIQSYWGQRGNFELIVPHGNRLAHYWRNNDDPNQPWNQAPDIITPSSMNPGNDWVVPLAAAPVSAALVQSNFNSPGNLELIVRMRPVTALGGDYLTHFYFDSGSMRWFGPDAIVADGERLNGVTGDPAFIQSTRGQQGHFELVVPQGNRLVHYYRDNDNDAFAWHKQAEVMNSTPGPITGDSAPIPSAAVAVALIQGFFGWPGNLELIVQVHRAIALADGDPLYHYWFDSANGQWHGPHPVLDNGQPVLVLAEE